jgi:biopolymer transport protein ExbD
MAWMAKSDRRLMKQMELNMTPMIDCVFQLLLFFMVSMKFKEMDQKLDADLPKAGKTLPDEKTVVPSEIWVMIKNGGTPDAPKPKVIIDQRVMRDWDDALGTLRRLSRAPGARQDPVIVAPDDDAQHGWVMKILDYLNQLQFRSINFRQ